MTFFPVSVDELKYDKNRIFTRLKLRADPNTNAYAESIFPYLVELLRENIELVLAYNITDNDLTIASPELSSCDMLAVCYCGATQKIVDCVDDLMAKSDFLEGYILNDLEAVLLERRAGLHDIHNAVRQLEQRRQLDRAFDLDGLNAGREPFEHGISGAVPLPAHAGRTVPRHAHRALHAPAGEGHALCLRRGHRPP